VSSTEGFGTLSPGRSCILLLCMLAKRIKCLHHGSLASIAMSGKMKANPDSGRIWNLITHEFVVFMLKRSSWMTSQNVRSIQKYTQTCMPKWN